MRFRPLRVITVSYRYLQMRGRVCEWRWDGISLPYKEYWYGRRVGIFTAYGSCYVTTRHFEALFNVLKIIFTALLNHQNMFDLRLRHR